MLLQNGADPNSIRLDEDGEVLPLEGGSSSAAARATGTLLEDAACRGLLRVVQLLLAYGADPVQGTTLPSAGTDAGAESCSDGADGGTSHQYSHGDNVVCIAGDDGGGGGGGGGGSGGARWVYPTALATVWPWLFDVSKHEDAEVWLQLLLVTVASSPGRLGVRHYPTGIQIYRGPWQGAPSLPLRGLHAPRQRVFSRGR